MGGKGARGGRGGTGGGDGVKEERKILFASIVIIKK